MRMADLVSRMFVALWCVPLFERCVLRFVRRVPGLKWRFRRDATASMLQHGSMNRWMQIPGGARVCLNAIGMYDNFYFDGKVFEPKTSSILLEQLRPGDTFLDIGANMGYFSLLAASVVGPEGKVIAFEANPSVREMLEESVAHNAMQERVLVPPMALSDTDDDSVTFYLSNDPGNSGISSMTPWEGHMASGSLSEQNVIKVPARRFDSWLAEHSEITRIDVVKIDVEGAEMLVFRGMGEVLKQMAPRMIVCETGPQGEVAKFLEELGYTRSVLDVYDEPSGWGNMLFERGYPAQSH